jgi:hypothetical protein
MKSLRMLAGTAALALVASALAPVPNAAALEQLRPLTCNQKLVDCIDQARVTFDCCVYGADPTTEGLLSGDCTGEPVAYADPATPTAPASVPACLLTYNGTTTACNVAYAICRVLNPGTPGAAK